jgi:hypothetical protein
MRVVDFTRLTIPEIEAQLLTTSADVRAAFGRLSLQELNRRPSAEAWSVAQCLDHLVQSNSQLCGAMTRALDANVARTIWQRLPFWPALGGRLLITTQSPTHARKFTAPTPATPSASHIDAGVIDRFVDTHKDVASVIRSLNGRDPARFVIVSPFLKFVTYSVLDALRLIAAHERRHYEQARRVLAPDPLTH